MSVTAIILAAGKGERFGSRISKPLVELAGKPILWYSLRRLARHRSVTDIVVVVNKKNRAQITRVIKKYRILKVSRLVLGGRRRQDSVRRGLAAVGQACDLVLIHDSGRPFIEQGFLSAVIEEARAGGAAIIGVPVKATIKKVRARKVAETPDRSLLWEIQTPQVFRRRLICKAYDTFWRQDATDDASMVERLGEPVAVVMGSYNNIKITTPEDLTAARAIAAATK